MTKKKNTKKSRVKQKKRKVDNQFQSITSNFAGLVRHDMMEGREYIVAPMVMLVEGVHTGSNGPLYYPPEELGKTPVVWNMKPVVVYHPQIDGQGVSACDPDIATNHKVGVIMNTHYENGKLKAEAWLEVDRVKAVDERILDTLESGEMMELSTGLFTDNEYSEGEWNGESFEAVVKNFRPDHLALLPDQKGACSISDGAGFLRLNQDSDSGLSKILNAVVGKLQLYEADQDTDKEEAIANRYSEKIIDLIRNQMSHDNIRGQLTREIQDKVITDPDDWVWVLDVYDTLFVYESQGKLWMLNYSKDNDMIQIEGEPVEVIQVTEYRRANDGSFVGNQKEDELTTNKERNKMNRSQKIDQLIKNGSWVEENREFLTGLEETLFDKLMETNKAPENISETHPTGRSAKETSPTAEETPAENTAPVDVNTYISNAPPEIAEVLTNSVALHNAEKADLTRKILVNKRNTFTEEQLKVKSLPELKSIAKLASNATPDYSGQGDPSNTIDNKETPLGLPTINFGEQKV